MTLSNKITLSRVILGPFAFWSIIYEKFYVTIAILVLNFFLDGLDGFVARFRDEKTKLGEIIDPLVDLLLFNFIAFAFYSTGVKEIVWVFVPFALIAVGFILSYFSKGKKFEILHSRTKYLHTPFLYLSAIFIMFKVTFWKLFFAISITIFSVSYLELLLRSLRKFLLKPQPKK